MIPVLLRFKGLYSYSSEQTIHFERLIEAGLFGIFGSVGSGKSSIIEAISFVLYYNTERMNSRENRLYHMMNLKSNELFIDFEFINFQGQEYRFGLRAKRSKKQEDKIENPIRSAYRRIKEGWEPIDPLEIDNIIGLSYENFKRTIIIPQGRFQEFLQLGDADRTRMMKEIFSLEKYDFGDRTSSLEKETQTLKTHLEGRLVAFSTLNEEAIFLSEKEVEKLVSVFGTLRKDLLEKEAAFRDMEHIKQLHLEKTQEKNKLDILLREEEEWSKLEEETRRLDYCLQHFKSEVDLQKRLNQQILSSNEALAAFESAREKEQTSFETIREEFEIRKQDYENHGKFQTSLQDLLQILEIRKLEEEALKLDEKVMRGSDMLASELQKHQTLEEKKHSFLSILADLKKNIPDISILSDVQIWFNQVKALTQDIESDQLKLAAFEKSLEKLHSDFAAHGAELSGIDYPDAFKKAELELDSSFQQNQEQQKRSQEELMHRSIQIKFSEYADSLRENDPCPLCGSLHHPDRTGLNKPSEEAEALKNRLDLLKQDEKMIHLAKKDLELSKNEILRITGEKKELHALLSNRFSRLESHRKEFTWTDYKIDQEEEVNTAKIRHQQMLSKINETELQQFQIEKELKENEKTLLQYRELLEKRKIELNTVLSRKEEKLSTLKTKAIDEVSAFDNKELEEKVRALERKITSVKTLYTACLEELNQKNAMLAGIKAGISEKKEVLQKERADLELIEGSINAKLSASAFSGLQEVEELLNDKRDWSHLRQEIKNYRIQVSSSSARMLSLEEKLQGKIFDSVLFGQSQEEFVLLKMQVQEKNDLLVQLVAELKDMKERFSEKQRLNAEHEKLSKRAENLKIMRSLFSGSGFVNYISSVHMRALCEEANKRFFKLSRQQLKLEVSETNNFLVRDFLNEGKLRSVKTLSGGQTFQASLALALALTESVQRQSKAEQNFFFLDEGFGSLDRESLQLAFDTLKSLYKENRIVGLISHVEDLQQEIGVFLQVSRDEVEGSQIHPSWESRLSR